MILFKSIFSFFEELFKPVTDLLVPKKAYAWQTLIYLSIFSFITSYFAVDTIRYLIEYFGWFFLIAGTAWSTTDKPVTIPATNMPIGALITSAFVSVFLFSRFFNGNSDIIQPVSVVVWPTLAAVITAIPEFFEGSGTDVKRQLPKLLVRQQILVLLGVCMMISCWIQFYYVIDDWFDKYPTVRTEVENFGGSKLILHRGETPLLNIQDGEQRKIQFILPKNGAELLNKLSPKVTQQLNERPWGEVERWLLDSVNQGKKDKPIGRLAQQVKQEVLKLSPEKGFWSIEPRVSNTKTGYKLDLLAIWNAPSFMSDKYYLQKSCEITPFAKQLTDNADENATVNVAEIECQSNISFIPKKPPAKN